MMTRLHTSQHNARKGKDGKGLTFADQGVKFVEGADRGGAKERGELKLRDN